jgi:hypothetical protein
MEISLTVWFEVRNQRRIALSYMTVQEKVKSLYTYWKKKKGKTEGRFFASHGWFNRFRKGANLHNVNLRQLSAGTVVAEEFFDLFSEVIDVGGYLLECTLEKFVLKKKA